MSYDVDAQIGGKLAQLGQRLVNGAAKKVADDFFENFAKAVNPAAQKPVENRRKPVRGVRSGLGSICTSRLRTGMAHSVEAEIGAGRRIEGVE